MKALFAPKLGTQIGSSKVSLGLLIFRIVVGVAFVAHGVGKIETPMGWMGPEAPVPGILQALAALAEFGGGLALIFGLLMPLATLGLIATMTVAVLFHLTNGDPFVNGYELALVYLASNVLLLLSGPGKYSLDRMIFKN